MQLQLVGIIICLFSATTVLSQSLQTDTTAISTFVKKRMASTGVPGVSLAIVSKDSAIYSRGYGLAEKGGREITPQTPMCLGSLTKSFTALATMQLIDRKQIKLHDPIANHLSNFESNSSNPNTITIYHLLTHTSGFSTFQGNQVIQSSTFNLAQPAALTRLVNRLSETDPVRSPGEIADYSNANYIILAELIQQVSGISYPEFIRKNILNPLKMNNSFIRGEANIQFQPSYPHKYWFGYPIKYNPQIKSGPIGPTGIFASAEDMDRYLRAIINQDPILLSSETYNLLFNTIYEQRSTPGEMGWRYAEPNGIDMLWHSGSCPGAINAMAIHPESKTGIVVMANALDAGFKFSNAGRLVDGPLRMMVELKPVPDGLNIKAFIMFLLLILAMVGFAVWGVKLIRSYRANSLQSLDYPFNPWEVIWKIGIPFVLLLTLAYGLLVFVPNMNDTLIWGAFWFAPDLAWLLTVVASLVMGIAIFRSIIFVKYALSQHKNTA